MCRQKTLSLQLLCFVFSAVCAAQVPVTTWHYDNMRTGANLSETILTPKNVVWTQFGKLFEQPVDGAIIGQALYLPGVSIPGSGTHNVVYVATMNDSVYAFDADSNVGSNASPLWQTHVLVAGATPVPMSLVGHGGVTKWTEVGVISTPVIDLATSTLYVLAKDYLNSAVTTRLWGIDTSSGSLKFTPVPVSATFTNAGTKYTFDTVQQFNRPALLLNNGVIYIAFGGAGANGLHQGWVLAYSAATSASPVPQLVGAFEDEPGHYNAGIWQKGGGPSADSAGNVYLESGDGQVVPGVDLGTSVMKFSQSGTALTLTDWFTPYNWNYLLNNDLDLNESVLVLPDQPGAHPFEAVAAGKEGTLYLLDRNNLGGLCSSCTSGDTQIVQELASVVGPDAGCLVYWNGAVYTSGGSTSLKAWPLTNGLLATTPSAQSVRVPSGHNPIISSNGTSNGVLWQLQGNGPGNPLQAFDAVTLKRIYASSQSSGRDSLPALPHFANMMEMNGKLYIGTNTTLAVFGLL